MKTIKYIWIGFVAGLLMFCIHVAAVQYNFLYLFGKMPDFETLQNPKSELASELYSSDGVQIGKYFRSNRSPVEYDEISPNMINALVATEDARYEEHSGIDGRAMARVFMGLFAGGSGGGGSTLSQQLAKNLFKMRDFSEFEGPLYYIPGIKQLIIKTKEWITAIRLERAYTKSEIITMYLNTVDFGSSAFGIKSASKVFFNTTPDKLKQEQAAVLVGVLKAPTYYSPRLNPKNSLNRRNTVLEQMYKYEYLSEEQRDSLSKLPLELDYEVENQNTGIATYFRTVLHNDLAKWAKERNIDIYSDGLKIYTTINSKAQAYAEQAMEEHMKYIQGEFDRFWKGRNPWIDESGREIPNFIENAIKRTESYQYLNKTFSGNQDSIKYYLNLKKKMKIFTWKGEKDTLFSTIDSLRHYKKFLNVGMLAVHPETGHIVAWVGGINHKFFKQDHVKQSYRQPGSTFKPFVYLAAIDNGYSPCVELQDIPYTFQLEDGNTWTPQNSEGEYTGKTYTLRQAMARSINSITANVMDRVSPNRVVDYCQRLGIKSKLDPVPSLCLGASDVSVYELVGAYSTFPNQGVYNEPQYLLRIEDKHGKVLYEHIPKKKEVLNSETAYLMCYMLQGGTQEKGGTALGLHRYPGLFTGNDVGGKTGTTSNYSDGWFMGVTQNLVTGVWVGGEDRCIHFTTFTYGQGAKLALPIVGRFMEKTYSDKATNITPARFKHPAQKTIETNCSIYKTGVADSLENEHILNRDNSDVRKEF
ncbi:MAG: transglycosylase domain-containing protein [Cytophagales bacterium]|jgi:penicillin-binding protein 1A